MRIRTNQKGFTLVETLVAITVLLLSIVGPMVMSARGLQTSFHARDQLIAVQLAQEGIELIREKRDQVALPGGSGTWLSAINMGWCDNGGTGCGIDARTKTFVNCANTNACLIRELTSSGRGFYTHQVSGTPTAFTRRIWVNEIVGGREAEITVEVTWRSGLFFSTPEDPNANIRAVIVQSRIFNQYDNI